jgi:outer membrane protein assembly factor BamC
MYLKSYKIPLTLLLASLLAGCGALPKVEDVLPDRKVEYKKSKMAGENLEIPPDLTKSSISDELVIPGAKTADPTTLSGMLEKERIQGRTAAPTKVLPKIDTIKVRRDGDQRWLEIQAGADDVWYKVVEFWQENGILLAQQDPTLGIMVTDWLENRADIKNDILTDYIRSVFDGAYSAATRDQFRIRVEPSAGDENITELYLTHRGMQETIMQDAGGKVERTVWNPRETDNGLEAEMLRRLMVYMGVEEAKASRGLAQNGGERQLRSRLNKSAGQVSLMVSENVSRAWRLTGVALDRVGFAVEDRDRTQGLYYVRYNDPLKDAEEPGLLDKLVFWKDNDRNIDKENQYQVSLRPDGNGTLVVVLNSQGARDNSETAVRILTLLNEQIR